MSDSLFDETTLECLIVPFVLNDEELDDIIEDAENGDLSDELIVKEDGGSLTLEYSELSDDQTTPVFGQ